MAIDAVLPLILRDLERAEFLFESLTKKFSGIRRIWIVCPDSQVAQISDRLKGQIFPFDIKIESELNIVPEFALRPKLSGWFKQQLIKLAMFDKVESDLYLTLDADIVCTRKLTADQLVGDGRGACHVSPECKFENWYSRARDVLLLKDQGPAVMHNVTPALLHRGAVAELKETIERHIREGRYSRGFKRSMRQRWIIWRSHKRSNYAAWRAFLTAAFPWTEYALYYTFLEATGRFDKYHSRTDYCIYDIEHSLWEAKDTLLPEDWDPSPAFRGEGPPWFIVGQSNTGISAAIIRQRLAPLLDGSQNMQ